MSRTLRVHQPDLREGELSLSEQNSRYVCRVHRLPVGASFVLFDPLAGTEAEARLTLAGPRARCLVHPLRKGTRVGLAGVSLLLGRPKAPALERVVRDCVALSAGRLVLVTSEHCVAAGSELNDRRLREVAIDEARQCERSDLPEIEGPIPFARAVEDSFIRGSTPSTHLVFDARATGTPLLDEVIKLGPCLDTPSALCLWIGPEGGFSAAELSRLEGFGARPVRLGALVLRVPTAVNAALSTVAAVALSAASGSKWACG